MKLRRKLYKKLCVQRMHFIIFGKNAAFFYILWAYNLRRGKRARNFSVVALGLRLFSFVVIYFWRKNMDTKQSEEIKKNLISDIAKRQEDQIIEESNAKLLINLCFLLSICFIYYPDKTLKYFQIKNKTMEILKFWFFEIDKVKNYKQIKYNIFGICSLISLDKNLQDKLVIDNIKLFIEKIFKLIDKVSLKIQKMEKEKEKEKKEENNINDENKEDIDDDELFKQY